MSIEGLTAQDVAAKLGDMSEEQIADFLAGFSDDHADAILHDWNFWARPEQRLPEHNDWFCLYADAGRGWGKTKTLCETTREWVKRGVGLIALIAQDAKDARDVLVQGPSGLLNVCWPYDRAHDGTFIGKPEYSPSLRRVTWKNGAEVRLYSSEDPEELRGPQFGKAAIDELAKFANPKAVWDQLMFGLRIPNRKEPPQVFVATTPRPKPFIKWLKARKGTICVGGSTFENAANLAPEFLEQLREDYEGTRLGRQELYAEYLEDVPGALWTRENLDANRTTFDGVPPLSRIVIAIDPAISTEEHSDETGIVAAGLGEDRRGYVLADVSGKYTPDGWATRAADLFERIDADCFVVEKNQGGDMVANTLRSAYPRAPIKEVHTTRGKFLRAEPVAALYEQNRVSHAGRFNELEDQQTAFTPDFDRGKEGYSPDRVDALVYALTELFPRVIRRGDARTAHEPQERAL